MNFDAHHEQTIAKVHSLSEYEADPASKKRSLKNPASWIQILVPAGSYCSGQNLPSILKRQMQPYRWVLYPMWNARLSQNRRQAPSPRDFRLHQSVRVALHRHQVWIFFVRAHQERGQISNLIATQKEIKVTTRSKS